MQNTWQHVNCAAARSVAVVFVLVVYFHCFSCYTLSFLAFSGNVLKPKDRLYVVLALGGVHHANVLPV